MQQNTKIENTIEYDYNSYKYENIQKEFENKIEKYRQNINFNEDLNENLKIKLEEKEIEIQELLDIFQIFLSEKNEELNNENQILYSNTLNT